MKLIVNKLNRKNREGGFFGISAAAAAAIFAGIGAATAVAGVTYTIVTAKDIKSPKQANAALDELQNKSLPKLQAQLAKETDPAKQHKIQIAIDDVNTSINVLKKYLADNASPDAKMNALKDPMTTGGNGIAYPAPTTGTDWKPVLIIGGCVAAVVVGGLLLNHGKKD